MNQPGHALCDFALTHLQREPLAKQAEIYRALAAFSIDRHQRARFLREAESCEKLIAGNAAHERRHAQLVLDFTHRTDRNGNGGAA